MKRRKTLPVSFLENFVPTGIVELLIMSREMLVYQMYCNVSKCIVMSKDYGNVSKCIVMFSGCQMSRRGEGGHNMSSSGDKRLFKSSNPQILTILTSGASPKTLPASYYCNVDKKPNQIFSSNSGLEFFEPKKLRVMIFWKLR